VRFAHSVREKERLIEAPLPESFGMERDGHDEVDVRNQTDVRCHPFAKRSSKRSAWPVFELVHGLTQRALKIPDRQSLIEQRRLPPACKARMFRTAAQSLGRIEWFAASWAQGPLNGGEVRPAGGTEKRDIGIADPTITKRAGGRKYEVQNTPEEVHNTSR
jgi:hypothetical protein